MKNDHFRICVVGIAFLILTLGLITPVSADETNVMFDFSESKTIDISPSSDGTLIDYQMIFDINYESEMQSDFDDLRFASENGTLLPYWIESKTDFISAKVWVKIPEIDGTNGATVKMYYGNSKAEPQSNGDEVFEFFDDFEGTSLNTSKWSVNLQSTGTYSVSNGVLYLDNPVEVFSTQVINSSIPHSVVFRSRLKNQEWGYSYIGFMNPSLSSMSAIHHYRTDVYSTLAKNNGSATREHWGNIAGLQEEYYNWHIIWDSNVSAFLENGDVYSTGKNVSSIPLNIGINTRMDTIFDHDSKVWTDWVYVKKDAKNEPAYSIPNICAAPSSVRTIVISNSGIYGALTGFQYTLNYRTLPVNATGYEYLHYYYDSNFTHEIPQYRDDVDSSVVTLKLDLNDGDTIIYECAEDEEAVSDLLSIFDLIEGLDTGGTITASRTPNEGSLMNILDNSTGTKAYYKTDASTYVIRDFGEPVYIYKLRAAFGTAAATQYIKVSNDGSTWTTLCSWSGDAYRHSVTPWYIVENHWRYVKLEKSGWGWHSYSILNVLSSQDTANTLYYYYSINASNFSNSKTISISPSSDGTLVDYQMDFDILYESEMQPDFDDLRFVDERDALLPYWIENKTDSVSAKVWVKIPVIDGTNGSTIKMYYGNPNATSESNIDSVMLLADMFEGNSIDPTKWIKTEYGAASHSVSDGIYTSTLLAGPINTGNVLESAVSFDGPIVVQADYYYSPVSGYPYADLFYGTGYFGSYKLATDGWYYDSHQPNDPTNTLVRYFTSGTPDDLYHNTNVSLMPSNAWAQMIFKLGDSNVAICTDGVEQFNIPGNFENTSGTLRLSHFTAHYQTGMLKIKNVFVHEYAADEPTYSIKGLPDTITTVSTTSSSGGGGGGGGATGETYENILVKEVQSIFINSGSHINYEFKEEGNAISSIQFDSLKNSGKIQATIEILSNRSSFAELDAPGEVYQQMNIWVGKTGFVSPDNVEDLLIDFKVEKAWLNKNNIGAETVKLYRYSDDKWNILSTYVTKEDDEYVYFESQTPGFSPFAIGSESKATEILIEDSLKSIEDTDVVAAYVLPEKTDDNGFIAIMQIMGGISIVLAGAYMVYRKRS